MRILKYRATNSITKKQFDVEMSEEDYDKIHYEGSMYVSSGGNDLLEANEELLELNISKELKEMIKKNLNQFIYLY